MKIGNQNFNSVCLIDFEFAAIDGNTPQVVCLVVHDLVSGTTLRVWQDELQAMSAPPYPIGEEALFVAYYASAEIGVHLSLGWDLPVNVLDLFAEFRNHTNGRPVICGNCGYLRYFVAHEALEKLKESEHWQQV